MMKPIIFRIFLLVLLLILELHGNARERNCAADDRVFGVISAENHEMLSGSSDLFHPAACKEPAYPLVQQILPEIRKLFHGEMLPDEFTELENKEENALFILESGRLVRSPRSTDLIYPFNYFW